MLSSNISSTCPHNMVNFGLLVAEMDPVVLGTPANFNGFRVLAALLHGSQLVSVSQTAAFNRGRHLYSAGRPSGWALAHISSVNLECRSEMWRTRLAANTGRKKVAKNRHFGAIAQFCWAISSQLRHVSTIGKKLVKQQYLLYMS